MGILKNFKDYLAQKNNKKFNTENLFVCDVGTFDVVSAEMLQIKVNFEHEKYKVFEELPRKEVFKYLKKHYGPTPYYLPSFHQLRRSSVRYFRHLEDKDIIIPCLSDDQAAFCIGETFRTIHDTPVHIKEFENIPDIMTLQEIKNLENNLNEKHKETMSR